VKGQPYGACQTVTALASRRRPQRPIVAGSPRRTRDVFRTGNPGEASSVTDAHNWAFRVTQKRQPDHLQAAQNRRSAPNVSHRRMPLRSPCVAADARIPLAHSGLPWLPSCAAAQPTLAIMLTVLTGT
jgi:hypothetical protein